LQLELLAHYVWGAQVGNGAVHKSENWLQLTFKCINISKCLYASVN
jgi:hypothetical protein